MNSDTKIGFAAGLLMTPVIICAIGIWWFICALMKGFVLTKLWVWFVIPLFPSVPVLALWQAVGLAMVVNYITGQQSITSKDHETNWGATVFASFILPWMTLFFGWICHLLIGA